ncbi:MAG TPA: hypothetical protein VGL86_00530 [Polyangia bacterium]
MTTAQQIAGFIAKFTLAMQKEARAARRAIRKWLPTATELVYDNYNGLVFGFAPGERASEAILSIVIMPDHVTLCFLRGTALDDPHKILRGSGSTVRHIRLDGGAVAGLGRAPVRALIRQAIARAKPPLPKTGRGKSLVRAIVKNQRPRRPKK